MFIFSTEIRPNLYIADGGLGDIKKFTTSTDYILMKQKKIVRDRYVTSGKVLVQSEAIIF